jgi:sigma-B regulation protein RsbU (phosphoserine phosphatase)
MRSARILVVDDEPGMLHALERVLGGTHVVMPSGSAREAVTRALEFKPDLAILDIRMPELDGFELMTRLKTLQPDMDVILMTGSVEDQDEKLVRAIRGRAFYFIQKPFDREVLRTLVDRCLELRWHREENHRHFLRMETELADARAFQQGLLPAREGTLGGVAVCCRYTPCSELGGDLYDYATDSAGRVALLVADVAGHGASAAMLTALVKSAFRASAANGYDPSVVVQRVWTDLGAFSLDRFVTLIAAVIAPRDGQLAYVNAGHPPGLLWGAHRHPRWLESTGPLVSAALRGLRWERRTLSIADGDQLLLYTDGVSDALADDHGISEEQICDAIQRHAEGGVQLLDAILADVDRHQVHDAHRDDLTLLTARIGASDHSR